MSFERCAWLFNSTVENRGVVRLNIAEAALLYEHATMAKRAIEIGRYSGGSAVLIADAMSRVDLLVSIDKSPIEEMDSTAVEWLVKHNFKPIVGDSRTIPVEWTDIDLLFIDGDHSYEGCANDIDRFVPAVRDGGTVIFHDAWPPDLCPGVRKAIDESSLRFVQRVDSLEVRKK